MPETPKIFQQFNLNLEELTKQEEEARKAGVPSISLLQRRQTLLAALAEQGYTVLIGDKSLGGVPEELLVSCSVEPGLERSVKTDFSAAAQKVGLPYMSGTWFLTYSTAEDAPRHTNQPQS